MTMTVATVVIFIAAFAFLYGLSFTHCLTPAALPLLFGSLAVWHLAKIEKKSVFFFAAVIWQCCSQQKLLFIITITKLFRSSDLEVRADLERFFVFSAFSGWVLQFTKFLGGLFYSVHVAAHVQGLFGF